MAVYVLGWDLHPGGREGDEVESRYSSRVWGIGTRGWSWAWNGVVDGGCGNGVVFGLEDREYCG